MLRLRTEERFALLSAPLSMTDSTPPLTHVRFVILREVVVRKAHDHAVEGSLQLTFSREMRAVLPMTMPAVPISRPYEKWDS